MTCGREVPEDWKTYDITMRIQILPRWVVEAPDEKIALAFMENEIIKVLEAPNPSGIGMDKKTTSEHFQIVKVQEQEKGYKILK